MVMQVSQIVFERQLGLKEPSVREVYYCKNGKSIVKGKFMLSFRFRNHLYLLGLSLYLSFKAATLPFQSTVVVFVFQVLSRNLNSFFFFLIHEMGYDLHFSTSTLQ